LWVLCVVR